MGMRPGDLLVEYRDRNLVRRGSIPQDDLRLKLQPILNGVGSWSVTLPAEHRAVPYLRSPGAGVIVTNVSTGEIVLSGSTSKPTKKATASDPKGMSTISGLSDDRLLWDAVSAPDPTNADFTTQTLSHDVFTGDAETVMRHFVDANIGQTAPAGRKTGSLRDFIRLEAVNKHLGALVTRSIRFDYIGDVLKDIATLRDLRFRIVQVGNILEFQVAAINDRSAFIRLDIQNGTLQEQSVEFAPPKVTRPIVLGQGDGAARQIVTRTTPDSIQAETDWALIIEQTKDQRNTDVVAELQQAGDELLAADGFTKVAVKATPTNDLTMVFQEDFDLGDKVQVVIDGQPTNSNITEAAIICDNTGLTTAIAIGDIRDFDSQSALRQTVADTERRVSSLERNIEIREDIYSESEVDAKFAAEVVRVNALLASREPVTMELDPFYIGPGPAMVRLVGGTTLFGPYEWMTPYNAQKNRCVIVGPAGGSGVAKILAHSDESSKGGYEGVPYVTPYWGTYENRAGGASWSPNDQLLRATRLASGIVSLQGLFINFDAAGVAAGHVLFTLPPNMRPDTESLFLTNNSDTARGVIISTNGDVRLEIAIGTGTYISLSGISFPAAGVATWTLVNAQGGAAPAFANGWTDYVAGGGAYGRLAYWVDQYGIMWWRGMVKGGTLADGVAIVNMPSSVAALDVGTRYHHFGALSGSTMGGLAYSGGTTPHLEIKAPSVVNWTSACGVKVITNPALTLIDWMYDSKLGFQSSWANYSGNFTKYGVGKRGDGLCMATGLINVGVLGQKISILPKRYRPEGSLLIGNVLCATGRGRVDIKGDQYWETTATPPGSLVIAQGSSTWLSLDGVTWTAG